MTEPNESQIALGFDLGPTGDALTFSKHHTPLARCADPWHYAKDEPFKCPTCGYWMSEGIVPDV